MKRGVPIRPDEVEVAKRVPIPEFVIDCFNEAILAKFENGKAKILLKDIEHQVEQSCLVREVCFRKEYLNVEPIFRSHGWDVKFDRPSFAEHYDSFYLFTQPPPDDTGDK